MLVEFGRMRKDDGKLECKEETNRRNMRQILSMLALGLLVIGCAPKQEKSISPVNSSEYTTSNVEGMKTVQEFLQSTHVYFLATVEGDQPQVRPFGTAEIIEGKLYIQTGHIKNVAKQIAANPKVAICAFNGEQWLRITATLVEDPRVEIKKAMLDANPGLRNMYDENDDNTAVYFLTEAKASINSFTTEPIVIEF